jgi:hypothetical protein
LVDGKEITRSLKICIVKRIRRKRNNLKTNERRNKLQEL